MAKAAANYAKLGRVAALGPSEPWQLALYLPERYVDLSKPLRSIADLQDDEKRPLWVRIASTPRVCWPDKNSRARRPWTVFGVHTPAGEEIGATLFGDTRPFAEQLVKGAVLCFLATCQRIDGGERLTLHSLVPKEWVGRIQPQYAGKPNVCTPESVRDKVLEHLHAALPVAVDFLRTQLASVGPLAEILTDVGAHGWSLEQVVSQCHLPVSLEHAAHANVVFQRLAALAALTRLTADKADRGANPIRLTTLASRIQQLPVTLTDDQANAIADVANQMALPAPMAHVVTGDVGVGKSYVAIAIAGALADLPNRRAVMLLPNGRLAAQLHADFVRAYPDVRASLVTGDTGGAEDLQAPVLIGTSALLHRTLGKVDLVIVDEQHRWSRAQREQLVGHGTHLLELTATPIPRTQALVQFGGLTVSEMRQTHAPKTFHTKIYLGNEGRRRFFELIEPSMRCGDQLLVVYPKRVVSPQDEEAGGTVEMLPGAAREKAAPVAGAIDDRYSVELARERWEKQFPGRVACITSDDDGETQRQVLADFTSKKVQILLTTTVVEVGLNLPTLYRIVVVCPERHGLVGLHQLRGRTARNGGEGYCDLLCPEPLKERQLARLDFFARTTDGFALAEYDLRERGTGDLGRLSDRQSGADETFLFGVKLDIRLLDEVLPVLQRWVPRAAQIARPAA